jgi:hypothetical protein
VIIKERKRVMSSIVMKYMREEMNVLIERRD